MGTVQTVPVIDVAPFLAGDPVGEQEVVCQVGRACETIGFLVLTVILLHRQMRSA